MNNKLDYLTQPSHSEIQKFADIFVDKVLNKINNQMGGSLNKGSFISIVRQILGKKFNGTISEADIKTKFIDPIMTSLANDGRIFDILRKIIDSKKRSFDLDEKEKNNTDNTILLQIISFILDKCNRLKLTNQRDIFLEKLFNEQGYIWSPVNDAYIFSNNVKNKYFDKKLTNYFFESSGYSNTGLDYVRTYT